MTTVPRLGVVLVGLGGGPGDADAVAFAAAWCRAGGDRMLLVTVHPGPAAPGAGRVDAEWVAYEHAEADRLLLRVRAGAPADVDVDTRQVEASSAAHGLHDLAEELDEPLVVVGTTRTAGHRRTLPGSTAERVLSGSPGAVAIVPHAYAEHPVENIRRVAVAYVDTPDGRTALDHANAVARHLGAELVVVSVVPDTLMRPTLGEPARFADAQRKVFADALDAAVSRTEGDVPVRPRLREGPVADTLAELGPDDADVLVCGSRGYGPVRRVLLGGVSNRLVRQARLPVVVVPRGGG